MSLVTNWGYTLTGELTTLPDLITAEEYNTFTAGKYSGDPRIESNIKAASQAIRNHCGWHIYPAAACSITDHLLYGNGRTKRVGSDLMIQLPAKFVTAVESVTIDDVSYTDFAFDSNGIVHVFDVSRMSKRSVVEVAYTAGIPDSFMESIKELVSHRVTHALASSNGVTSEAAGGVSVTYNANWINSARATALPDDNKEVLAPYKIQGVF